MVLGSGELGKEFVLAAKRLGLETIAVDKYPAAPAMQVADKHEVFSMLDGDALEAVVKKHQPDFIVPEVESIRTSKLYDFERQGIKVIPNAFATEVTMNREKVREIASKSLGLKTARYLYASNLKELSDAINEIGCPCIVKPLVSSSGKGQTLVKRKKDAGLAWENALAGMRGDLPKIIVEEFISFDSEITLLTIRQKNGKVLFVKPIGHRQEDGDFRESWMPAKISDTKLKKAQAMAKKMVNYLGGEGLFGVEFFITKNHVYFSELSPRPHDTGMVTLVSQNISEFELHLRAILNLPIPEIKYERAAACAALLGTEEAENYQIKNLHKALKFKGTQVLIFGKPTSRKNRRLGLVLTKDITAPKAVNKAVKALKSLDIEYS